MLFRSYASFASNPLPLSALAQIVSDQTETEIDYFSKPSEGMVNYQTSKQVEDFDSYQLDSQNSDGENDFQAKIQNPKSKIFATNTDNGGESHRKLHSNYQPSLSGTSYASPSLLLANPLTGETVSSPTEEQIAVLSKSDFDAKTDDQEIADLWFREWLPTSLIGEPNEMENSDFPVSSQGIVSDLAKEDTNKRENQLTQGSNNNSLHFFLRNIGQFSNGDTKGTSLSPNLDATQQLQFSKAKEQSQSLSESILQRSHLNEVEIDLILDAIAKEIQQQYRQFYGS